MLPIRSPLGAIGAILVALEGVAGGSLFALESGSGLQTAMATAMIFVLVAVTVVILGIIIYLAVRKPAFLFNPADISESAHLSVYGGGSGIRPEINIPPEAVIISPTITLPSVSTEPVEDELPGS